MAARKQWRSSGRRMALRRPCSSSIRQTKGKTSVLHLSMSYACMESMGGPSGAQLSGLQHSARGYQSHSQRGCLAFVLLQAGISEDWFFLGW